LPLKPPVILSRLHVGSEALNRGGVNLSANLPCHLVQRTHVERHDPFRTQLSA